MCFHARNVYSSRAHIRTYIVQRYAKKLKVANEWLRKGENGWERLGKTESVAIARSK